MTSVSQKGTITTITFSSESLFRQASTASIAEVSRIAQPIPKIQASSSCQPENAIDLKVYKGVEHPWTALIWQHAKRGQVREAVRLYEGMRKDGVEPSSSIFVALLKACSVLRDLKTVKHIHAEVVSSGLESDLYVNTMLVDVYARCKSLADARRVFEKMPHRDVVSWTAMLFGYIQMDKGEEVLHLYKRMQQEGVTPNGRTYVCALKACGAIAESGRRSGSDSGAVRRRCLEAVKAIHTDIVEKNFKVGLFVGNTLVAVYAKCGSLEDSRQVFEDMPQRDVVSWNALILGYAEMDNGKEALQLYSRMQAEGVIPDDRTYVSALKACSVLAASEDGVGGDSIAKTGRCLNFVRAIHERARREKFESDLFVGNTLLDAYAKCKSLEEARQVFDVMPHRDVVTWTAMIFAYAQMDKGDEALSLYNRMAKEGMTPNDRTYVSALKACSTLAGREGMNDATDTAAIEKCLEIAKSIHRAVAEQSVKLDIFVGTMLVDVYTKCMSLENARSVFEKLPHRDVVCWNAMMSGYVQNDEGEVVLNLYSRMQQQGVVPNDRTFVNALSACGTTAALEKGKEIHAQILQAGLQCDPFVANSLVDMYAKCGDVVAAQQVFDSSPTKDIVAWTALIAGYVHLGESEVVFDLFQRMIQEGVQPDGVAFLSVLTVCSHVGLMDRGQEYFDAMSQDYGITPTIKHFTCMVDLLGRSGRLAKALKILQTMSVQPDSAAWECFLGACQKWGNVELGRQGFECAITLNKEQSAPYILMSNIYEAAHMQEEAKQTQALRVKSRAWKQPGWSQWTDKNGIAHVFVVGDQGHSDSLAIYTNLEHFQLILEHERCIRDPRGVLRNVNEEQKMYLLSWRELFGNCARLPEKQLSNQPVKTSVREDQMHIVRCT